MPHKETKVTLTFLAQGTNFRGAVENVYKNIETTLLRRNIVEQAKRYAEASSYLRPCFVIHDYLADCKSMLVNIKGPQGDIIWENDMQEI